MIEIVERIARVETLPDGQFQGLVDVVWKSGMADGVETSRCEITHASFEAAQRDAQELVATLAYPEAH